MTIVTTPSNDRTTLRYQGALPVQLPEAIHPQPAVVNPGDIAEVDTAGAEMLLRYYASTWEQVNEPPTGPYDNLSHDDLVQLCEQAGISADGTDDELRARLVEFPPPPGTTTTSPAAATTTSEQTTDLGTGGGST